MLSQMASTDSLPAYQVGSQLEVQRFRSFPLNQCAQRYRRREFCSNAKHCSYHSPLISGDILCLAIFGSYQRVIWGARNLGALLG